RTTVAVTFLVKNPSSGRDRATVHYRDIGDYLTREDKLAIVNDSLIDSVAWQSIKPNDAGDWINQRSDQFDAWQPIADRGGRPVFAAYSRGLSSGRDAWVYNYSPNELEANVTRMVEFY